MILEIHQRFMNLQALKLYEAVPQIFLGASPVDPYFAMLSWFVTPSPLNKPLIWEKFHWTLSFAMISKGFCSGNWVKFTNTLVDWFEEQIARTKHYVQDFKICQFSILNQDNNSHKNGRPTVPDKVKKKFPVSLSSAHSPSWFSNLLESKQRVIKVKYET